MNGYQEGYEPKKKSSTWLIVLLVGGTLILISSVCVIGVLAAILVPNFLKARVYGQMTACESNLKNIATALEMYATDNDGAYPLSVDDVTKPAPWGSAYMKALPLCPACQKPYMYQNTSTEDEDSFLLTCGEINCHIASEKVGDGYFPQYTPGQGVIYR